MNSQIFFSTLTIYHMSSCSKSCVISYGLAQTLFIYYYLFLLSICHVSESVKLYLSNLFVFIDFLPALFGLFLAWPPGFPLEKQTTIPPLRTKREKIRKAKGEREREGVKEKSVSVSLFFFMLLPPLFLFFQTRSNLVFLPFVYTR